MIARKLVRVFSLDMLHLLNDNFLPYDKVFVCQILKTCSMLLGEEDGSRKLAVSNFFIFRNVV